MSIQNRNEAKLTGVESPRERQYNEPDWENTYAPQARYKMM